ncbi:MAG: GCN5-related N-acetyltransferase [Frankiales bacterium]|nr:GCN5-related N-acetyltransferase [Frankiales bacterium]
MTLTTWTRDELAAHADDVLEVYAEAMQVSRGAARSRRSVLAAHLDRPGLLAVAALDEERLIGIAYGYQGAPGQWWHDHVRAAMGPRLAQEWLRDAFEVCELHVRPAFQQQGIGRDLLVRLLSQTRALTAVLTTPDAETRARTFYRDGGWVDLVRDLRFPGDPRSFAVLGLAL